MMKKLVVCALALTMMSFGCGKDEKAAKKPKKQKKENTAKQDKPPEPPKTDPAAAAQLPPVARALSDRGCI